jgi:methenyltetrahydromethanopterin cyclohydrolase
MPEKTLNERAWELAEAMASAAADWHIKPVTVGRARVLDCGVEAAGGLEAGIRFAQVCLAGMAKVNVVPGTLGIGIDREVAVTTDWPLQACMAAQYAGWQVKIGDYAAMASGPMRAHYGKEELFDRIGCREKAPVAVGALETGQVPTEPVISYLCDKLELAPKQLVVLVAPTASMVGAVQIAARALESALHKLDQLKFDIRRIESGCGAAPVPPVAANEAQAMGRGNDAILYGGRVALWLRAEDGELEPLGPRVPANASKEHGQPFATIFERQGRDFYRIDPMLFGPAEVTFHNLANGATHVFGRTEPEVLQRSFAGSA